ncbi:MAG TPA: hypothetical protein VN729_08995 [Ktedonobacteraceae bacterium]|nr:hypothetical protein [Ktedonobacteraceae bacterium]
MTKIFARIQIPSLRWGLIFGIILGIVEVIYNFAASFITEVNVQSILGYVAAILFIVMGFYAGLRASQETGKWTSGFVAGIWVAIIGTVIFYVIPLVNTFINLQSFVASAQLYLKTHPVSGMKPSNYTASDVIITELLGLVASMINCALFTIIGGGLGGFMGRRRSLALATPANTEDEEVLLVPPASETEVELQEAGDEAQKAERQEVENEADNVELPVIKDEATK